MSNWNCAPRKTPEEFDSEAGTPENRLAISRKAVSCLALSGTVELFGRDEVAHDQRNAVIAGIDARDDALGFRYREAEPVHAGVDLDGGAATPTRAPAKHVPFGEFVEVADHGPAVDPGIGLAGVLEEAIERIDRSLRQRRAHGSRFVQRGDEECLAAGRGERAGDRFDAAAIGIGLDHAGAFGRHGGLLQLAPVGDDGVEVDGQDPGRVGQRRRLVGFG